MAKAGIPPRTPAFLIINHFTNTTETPTQEDRGRCG